MQKSRDTWAVESTKSGAKYSRINVPPLRPARRFRSSARNMARNLYRLCSARNMARNMLATCSALSPLINVPPPVRERTWRATLSICKTNPEARFNGLIFATRRHNRTCCSFTREDELSPPSGGNDAAGNVSRKRRQVKQPQNAPARAPPFSTPKLRGPKSDPSVKMSILAPTPPPPPGETRAVTKSKESEKVPDKTKLVNTRK